LRIFVEPGSYRWGNLGDVMMLEAALARLRAFWPDASITVHCLDPERLRLADPLAKALDPSGSERWSRVPRLLRPAARRGSVSRRLRQLSEYIDAIRSADLLLLSGAGSLTDSFKQHALALLLTIEIAIDNGAAVVLMGQGIGPMKDAEILHRAAAVLPRVDFIASREGVAGPSLLHSIGVAPERIAITGDETIPFAFAARPEALGASIGVNVRAAPYAGVDDDVLQTIGSVLQSLGKPLLPIPISRYSHEDDLETVRRMLGDSTAQPGPATSAELLRIVSQCRVVVTGSYHAGVLALSMGIPVVAVAGSVYYGDKFRGLAGQFGPACRVELTTDSDFAVRLRAAIDDAWQSAEATRAALLDAAARQIESIEHAYRHVFELATARRPLRRRL
jgi:polysaccharide pyruvyl transferase WcaK-like protein